MKILHPDFLLAQLSSRQIAEWMAEYNLTPFGQDRSDLVVAEVGAWLWNQNRGKNVEPINAEAFIPQHRPQQSAEEMKLALRRYLPSGNR